MSSVIHHKTFNALLGRIVSSPVNLLELKALLEEKPFRAVDTGIHPKVLADWNRHELLMIKPEPNKMHRFSLTEFVWVKIIEKMRQYSFPLNVIKEFKDSLIMVSFSEQLNSVTPSLLFEMMKDMEGIKDDPEKFREYLDTVNMTELLGQMLPPQANSGNVFEMLIVLSVSLRTPISFLIDHSGKGILFNPLMLNDGLYSQEEISDLFSRSFVSIALTEILCDVLILSDVDILHGQLMILSDQEANVIQAVREDDLISVHIRFDNNHEMDLLEVKKLQRTEREARLMDLILKQGYQDITVKTQHGKVVYCENTRKMKL